jgi:AsmA protein
VQLRDGALTTADVGAEVAPVLTRGLAALGLKDATGTVPKAAQGTRLNDLSAQFRVQGGWVAFTKPMAFQSDPGGLPQKGSENPVNQARKGLGDLFKRPRK